MDRGKFIWFSMLLLQVDLGVATTEASLIDLENIAGKLVFYQIEGNATYVRNTGELASDVLTETTFELNDPQKTFTNAKFTYTWDLGNGEVIHGTEPVVRYHYSASGNYTLRLKVGVNVTESAPFLKDVYSKDVKVLDAIKNIELKGHSDYEMSQDSSLAFQVDGSPPMWVCWHFLPKCEADPEGTCTLTMLYENTLWLNHTFTSAGIHCLDISIQNDISKLQTSFSLSVKRNNNHMVFILSCAAVLVATFSFITVIACRPRHQQRPLSSNVTTRRLSVLRNERCMNANIAASGNALFLKTKESEEQSSIHLNVASIEKGEKKPLLQHGNQH